MIRGSLEVTFPKLNHFWLDSGLLGFYQLLNGQDGIAVVKQDNGVTLRGAEEDIRSALTHAYDYCLN